MAKGKRKRSGKSRSSYSNAKRHGKLLPRQRGYDRTVGYYGRYNRGLDSEKKFHDVDADDDVVSLGGTIQNALLTIVQGATESQRIGRKITITDISLNMSLSVPATTTAADGNDVCRVMLILDKQCNGALPALITEVLESANFDSFNNLANKGRFRTLWQKKIVLNHTAGGWNGANVISFESGKNLSKSLRCNIPIEYDNTAATGVITTIRSNNIFMLYISKNGLCGVDCSMRFRYTDS